MLMAALRDLQWRRRRFAIAVVGASLVFGITLVMAGMGHAFDVEAAGTVRDLGVDGWVVRSGASGPFLGASPMAERDADEIARLPGVRAAVPSVFIRKTVRGRSGDDIDVNVLGGPLRGPGVPVTVTGRPPSETGEIAISSRLPGYDVGDDIDVSGTTFRVVGETGSATALGGAPNVFLTLRDAQRVGFAGQPVVAAVGVIGTPSAVPDGFEFLDRAEGEADLLRAIKQAQESVVFVSLLLWVVAASIMGAVIYLSALERQRDFAVFKATGVKTGAILGGLVLQAVLMALLAAALGSVIAILLAPRFPMLVSIQLQSHLLMPAIAVAIGGVASVAGIRRAVAVDPALAFGGP